MSVIVAIFQALFQALCQILPISESAHSSVFHVFSNRLSGANASLTGFIHIGIGIGIVASMYKVFLTLSKEIAGAFADITKKQLPSRSDKPSRRFALLALLSLVPMLLLLIPVGKGRLLYDLLNSTMYNSSLIEDGLLLSLLGVIVILVSVKLKKSSLNKDVSLPMSIVVGFACIPLVTLSGLSQIFGVIAILVFFGVSIKQSFRYSMAIAAPVLIVNGIVEVIKAVTKEGIVSVIIALLVSTVLSFFLSRILRNLIKKNYIIYFGYYDISLGIIILIIGLFRILLK